MSRRCPRTGTVLKPVELGDVVVDLSESCGGVFFDRFELQRFDDDVEFDGERLAQLMSQWEDSTIDHEQRIKCPNCPDVVMMRRAYSPLRKIELDECPACAGIWLDSGELSTLRRELPNEEARNEVGKKFIAEMMSSPEVVQHEKELSAIQARSERIAHRLWRLIGL